MRVLGLNGIGSVPARFCVINPPTVNAIPAKTSSTPSIHRNAPCTKLVGTNHSSARATRGSAGRIEAAAGLECRDDLVQAAVRKASEVKSRLRARYESKKRR